MARYRQDGTRVKQDLTIRRQQLKRNAKGKLVRRDIRKKQPHSSEIAKPKVKYIGHGGGSALLKDPLDRRTRVGKAYKAHKEILAVHVGGDPSTPQVELIDQAARLRILSAIAWAELMRARTLVKNGNVHPAFDAFLKAARDQRAVLEMLGLKRQARDVPLLKDVLTGS